MVVHSAYMVHAALGVDPDGVIRLSTNNCYHRASDLDWRCRRHWHDQEGLCPDPSASPSQASDHLVLDMECCFAFDVGRGH